MDKIVKEKNTNYDVIYNSSACDQIKAELGTVEKDSCGHFGRFDKEKFRGSKILKILLRKKFTSILDIGPGKLEAVDELIKKNKKVDICEFDDGHYFNNKKLTTDQVNECFFGDFNEIEFNKTWDAIWCSHVLEHQLNPNFFLKKINMLLKENGYLAIVVPPRKPIIVGGHVSLWNAGLLLYHLVLAGFDCSEAQVLQYDYNIGIILKKKKINLPKIHHDVGDLLILKKYFPFDISTDNFNGDIFNLNI